MMSDLFGDYNYEERPQGRKKRSGKDITSGIFISPEMFIGWVILFIVGLVFSFCLGVGQGRRLAALDERRADILRDVSIQGAKGIRGKRNDVRSVKTRSYESKVTDKEKVSKSGSTNNIAGTTALKRYAVQLVVYRDEKYTKKEIDYLNSKKIPFLIQNKNGKIIISAGPFASRKEAESATKKLKDRYRDCFVKLVRKV